MKVDTVKKVLVLTFALLLAGDKPLSRTTAINEALERIKINPSKLSFNLTFTDIDPFRLRFVNYLLSHPLKTIDFTDSVALKLVSAKEPLEIVRAASEMLELKATMPVLTKGTYNYPWKSAGQLTAKLKESLDIIYTAILRAEENIKTVRSGFTTAQLDSLYNFLPYLLEISEEETESKAELTVEEEDSISKSEQRLSKGVLNLAARIDRTKISESAMTLIYACDLALKTLQQIDPKSVKAEKAYTIPEVSGDILYYTETPQGAVVIGGAGKTVYSGNFLLIIDLGGDDEYLLSAGGATNSQPISIAIDIRGNDIYRSKEPYAFGSAFLGAGILIDCEGSDLYDSKNFGIATGIAGFGFLWDQAGSDLYRGDTGTEGCGYIGAGILLDSSGNDYYYGHLYAQGFGYVGGCGLLFDKEGNDCYVAQGKYQDKIRRRDHNLSLSQGFGFGARPDFSGGVGILLDDGNGNDTYIADVFAQGASYWYAFGALVDRGGNDTYQAFQYAQGCGTHITIGALIDYAGDDNYLSHSVSQGCGHDLALGVLNDREGDDNYVIYDLSQGAGNANGIGILVDEAGDDSYTAKQDRNSQGYGNFRREYGSIGLMLDLAGKDSYIGKGGDESEWTNGRYGIGIDFVPQKQK